MPETLFGRATGLPRVSVKGLRVVMLEFFLVRSVGSFGELVKMRKDEEAGTQKSVWKLQFVNEKEATNYLQISNLIQKAPEVLRDESQRPRF